MPADRRDPPPPAPAGRRRRAADRPAPDRSVVRARLGVAAVFLVNGVLWSDVVPRIPELKDDLALGNAALGLALAALPGGGLLAGLLASAVIVRWRSARVAVVAAVGMAATTAVVPHAGSAPALAAVLLVAGMCDGLVDVAQNAHGLRVQRRYGRSIVNAFHGLWSVGAVLGGLVGSAAAGLDVPLGRHLAVVAVAATAVVLAGGRLLLPGPDADDRPVATAATPAAVTSTSSASAASVARRAAAPTLLALGALAAASAVVEDAGASWGALYGRVEVGAAAGLAGLAFVAFQVAMTAGRLGGDRVVDRYGARAVARAGAAAIAAGTALLVGLPSMPGLLAGFGLAGLGAATVIPAALHAADEVPGLPAGLGLSIVSWLLRVGFLVAPPAIGVVADARGLRVALLLVVLAAVAIAVLARALPGRAHPGGGRVPPDRAAGAGAGPIVGSSSP